MKTNVPVVAVVGAVVSVLIVLTVGVVNAVVVPVVAVEGDAVVPVVATGVVSVDSDAVVSVVAVVAPSEKQTYTQLSSTCITVFEISFVCARKSQGHSPKIIQRSYICKARSEFVFHHVIT